jgi:hypothetical protein
MDRENETRKWSKTQVEGRKKMRRNNTMLQQKCAVGLQALWAAIASVQAATAAFVMTSPVSNSVMRNLLFGI